MRALECLLQMYVSVTLGQKNRTNGLRFQSFIYSSKSEHNQNYRRLRRSVSHRDEQSYIKGNILNQVLNIRLLIAELAFR